MPPSNTVDQEPELETPDAAEGTGADGYRERTERARSEARSRYRARPQ